MKNRRDMILVFTLNITVIYLLLSWKVHKNLKCLSFEELVSEEVSMDDNCLIHQIRKTRLFAPSKLPYNLTTRTYHLNSNYTGFDAIQSFSKDMDAPWVEALIAVEIFVPKGVQRRFFECGALDGVTFSTTLHMERFLNWTGVLIEPDDRFYSDMRLVHRKAYGVHACASRKIYPSLVNFKPSPIYIPANVDGINITRSGPTTEANKKSVWLPGIRTFPRMALQSYWDSYVLCNRGRRKVVNPGIGQIPNDLRRNEIEAKTDLVWVHCVPVYSILLAVNMTKIDLFILDVEGVEIDILETIPFDKVHIAVFMIEVYGKPEKGIKRIHELMHSRGYTFYDRFEGGMHPGDDIFIKQEYLKNPENWKKLKRSNVKDIYKIITGKEDKDISKSDIENFLKLSFRIWGTQVDQ